jgi:hypothetical protein
VTKSISSKTVTVCKPPHGEAFNSKNIPTHPSSLFAEKRRYVCISMGLISSEDKHK